MSVTSEFAQAVKEAARLWRGAKGENVSILLLLLPLLGLCIIPVRHVHQAYSYFEHVVAQRKIAEAVPGVCGSSLDALLSIAQCLGCVLV